MAAKVVMVAVPTVLGIASIRVYTVEEAPADTLASREKLNFYTQLPPSAPARFVPERPGLIQSGVTAAREGILPLVQALKGACLSLKNGAVNVYYAGEDVYYYLKDPPPEFLPRFGAITMAGLLGMFLSRKGSRFRRVAVPLGLMGAGASVCYPAQTVAVVKVVGTKLYAAGRWSSTATSSLLSAKPSEPPPSLQTYAAAEDASEAPVPGLAENPPVHSADPVAESRPAEMRRSRGAEETPAAGEGQASSDTKQAAGWLLPSGPGALQPAPLQAESAPGEAEPASAESFPGEIAAPSPEETSGPNVSHDPSAEPEPLPPAESADPPQAGGAGFKPEPSLMDFGQSRAEDEDLYSTRS